ncbi:uncharacterized protein TORIP [Prorops nasuta]|uniref:uncharacterized protein TORIP n=1 Tax=Prorops nasuta TaxID=863751 RepID=UPI0034CEE168
MPSSTSPKCRKPIHEDTYFENENSGFYNRWEKIQPKSINTKRKSLSDSKDESSHNKNFPFGNTCTKCNTSTLQQSNKPNSNYKTEKKTVNNIWLLIIIIVILLIFIFCISSTVSYFIISSNSENKKLEVNQYSLQQMLSRSLQQMQIYFHNQNDKIWDQIICSIEDVIVRARKPAVLMLFANERKTVNCFASCLGKLASEALNSNDFLTLAAEDINQDLGNFFHELHPKIAELKTVVIQDLLEINPTILQILHNLCDRESPLVKQAFYIITLSTRDGFNNYEKELPYIEKLVFEKFVPVINEDILLPLITRITDGPVIFIESEMSLKKCPCIKIKR